MAQDIATISILGKVQPRDAEVRYLPDGTATLAFSLVVGRSRKDRDSGEWINESDWYSVTMFGSASERLAEKVVKGARVYVTGKVSHQPYTSKAGELRMSIRVNAQTLTLIDDRNRFEKDGTEEKKDVPFEDIPF